MITPESGNSGSSSSPESGDSGSPTMDSPEQQLQGIQKELLESDKESGDFMLAILETLKLEERYASNTMKFSESKKFLTQAEEELAPEDFQLLLDSLSNGIKPDANEASRLLQNYVLKIQSAGNTAPVSQSHAAVQPAIDPVAAAQQAMQRLKDSEQKGLDFDEAILATVKLDLDAVERTQVGPCVMLDMAKARFAAEHSRFNSYMHSLCLQLGNQDLRTENGNEARAKAFNMKEHA